MAAWGQRWLVTAIALEWRQRWRVTAIACMTPAMVIVSERVHDANDGVRRRWRAWRQQWCVSAIACMMYDGVWRPLALCTRHRRHTPTLASCTLSLSHHRWRDARRHWRHALAIARHRWRHARHRCHTSPLASCTISPTYTITGVMHAIPVTRHRWRWRRWRSWRQRWFVTAIDSLHNGSDGVRAMACMTPAMVCDSDSVHDTGDGVWRRWRAWRHWWFVTAIACMTRTTSQQPICSFWNLGALPLLPSLNFLEQLLHEFSLTSTPRPVSPLHQLFWKCLFILSNIIHSWLLTLHDSSATSGMIKPPQCITLLIITV